jgi:hypothetical protein
MINATWTCYAILSYLPKLESAASFSCYLFPGLVETNTNFVYPKKPYPSIFEEPILRELAIISVNRSRRQAYIGDLLV